MTKYITYICFAILCTSSFSTAIFIAATCLVIREFIIDIATDIVEINWNTYVESWLDNTVYYSRRRKELIDLIKLQDVDCELTIKDEDNTTRVRNKNKELVFTYIKKTKLITFDHWGKDPNITKFDNEKLKGHLKQYFEMCEHEQNLAHTNVNQTLNKIDSDRVLMQVKKWLFNLFGIISLLIVILKSELNPTFGMILIIGQILLIFKLEFYGTR
jgi:uncharacterized membrane protein